ncbi:MAG: hypothetical protein FWD17_19095 [Polyangiaceae bacterium]|nr:hypothetical protein [Polyangiaceae bacterium]
MTRFSWVVFVAGISCGGASKPAQSAADTSSLEAKDSPAPKADAEPAKASPAAESTPAPQSATDSAPKSAPSSPSSPSSPPRAAPAVTGTIDGKSFSPKIARTMGKVQKDGRILVALDEAHEDCNAAASEPGQATLTMLVTWQDGYKVDLGSLKRGTPKKAAGGEITFSRSGAGGKQDVSPTFKPSGTVTIVKAPTDANATGKMKIDLQSGAYMLAGDLDVLVCSPAK